MRFTFANFLHLFIQGPPLTHSAMVCSCTALASVVRLQSFNTNCMTGQSFFEQEFIITALGYIKPLWANIISFDLVKFELQY